MFNKRGQSNTIGKVVGVIFAVFILLVVVLSVIKQDVGEAFNIISDFTYSSVGPAFSALLGSGTADANNQFLMILSFILISIIIIGTLDSVNIFGDTKQGGLINFAVGIIVSIIGVRFMPQDMWASLTAPSSAFVATILVGAPFVALFFVTMKLQYPLARKLLWLFYLIFMSYLIFIQEGNDFKIIYIIFLIAAGVMMFFDSTVRRYFYLEKHKKDIEDTIGQLNAQQRYNLRRQIEKWQKIIGDTTAPKSDIATAKTQLANARTRYGDISAI